MTHHGGHLRPADAPRHQRRLLTAVRQARPVLRGKIESGQYRQGNILPAADLAREYKVTIRVTYCALAMLAANQYISRPEAITSCSVTWQAGT
jgi:DNA-binding FadR family transcriptional regulator